MDTLDQGEGNQRISERAIRNLTSSSVWVIITSACGIFAGLFMLYLAFKMMSMSGGYMGRAASQAGGIYLIIGLIYTSLHIVGLNYGISLSKLKIYSVEDFERASSRQNAYWIFAGIIAIIWTLLMLLALAGGGFNRMF